LDYDNNNNNNNNNNNKIEDCAPRLLSEEEKKAAARAYALSGTSSSNQKSHKRKSLLSTTTTTGTKATPRLPLSLTTSTCATTTTTYPSRTTNTIATASTSVSTRVPFATNPHGYSTQSLPHSEQTSRTVPPDAGSELFQDMDEYQRFVKSLELPLDNDLSLPLFPYLQDDEEDEEEEFQLDLEDDDDDDEEEEEEEEDGGDDDDNNNNKEQVQEQHKWQQQQPHPDPTSQPHSRAWLSPIHPAVPTQVTATTATTTNVDPHTLDDLQPWPEDPDTAGDALNGFYRELEEELGWLEEEDMEAAVATLLDHPIPKGPADDLPKLAGPYPDDSATDNSVGNGSREGEPGSSAPTQRGTAKVKSAASEPALVHTPLRDAARAARTVVTDAQHEHLKQLMNRHYQVLTQQAVLSVRAAHYNRLHRGSRERHEVVTGGESGDDLVEILDAAVGMLQDLDQNRKDAIRHYVQFRQTEQRGKHSSLDAKQTQRHARRSLFSAMEQEQGLIEGSAPRDNPYHHPNEEQATVVARRLTRAQFTKTLQEQSQGETRTVFDVPGLSKLGDTFKVIDKSVEGVGRRNILELDSPTEACQLVLDEAGAEYDTNAVPSARDVSLNFVDAKEYFGPSFQPPSTPQQEMVLRRNRNLFTAGEDNLVLRGVNLYGEKQWILIADRFLPDRSINIISQRYSKLCMMIYRANGIRIDRNGDLEQPPKLESVDDLDEEAVDRVKPVPPPAVLNVHRWSMEEDLTLLRAVPLFGHMWAELGARLIPHRDRGHLRKRYQVLERRVKATVLRANKHDNLKVPTWTASPAKPVRSSGDLQPYNSRASGIPPPPPVPSRTTAPSKKRTANQSVNHAAAILASARSAPAANVPQQVHSPIEENSRLAFEQLVNGSTDDWSRMTGILETDESEVANAIVNQLAKSPAKPSIHNKFEEAAQSSQLNSEAESRALSLLADTFSPRKRTKASQDDEQATQSVSFLAGVLEHAQHSEVSQGNNTNDAKMKPPLPVYSPSKGSVERRSLSTPIRKEGRSTIYSTSGTPVGLSPGFRSPTGNSNWKLGSPVLESITMESFPAGMASRMTHEEGHGHSMDGYDLNKMFEHSIEAGGEAMHVAAHDVNSNLSGMKAIETEALEAISALNSLSNSPAKTFLRRANSQESSNETGRNSNGGLRRSLFANVVGDAKASTKQRKLNL
jgi:hypothetical protein